MRPGAANCHVANMNIVQRRTLLSGMAASPLATLVLPMGGAEAAAIKTGYVKGKVAPDLTFLTPTGATRKLSELRGKFVVLELTTLWCPRSQDVTRELRPFVDSVNAPRALKAPLVWVSAEFDGFAPSVAPTPGQLVRFGLRYKAGDPKSPMAWFGPAGGATYQAGQAQLTNYATANAGIPGYPTYVVLSPTGVILTVLQGFVSQREAAFATPTMTQIRKAIGAKNVPYQATTPPYGAAVVGGVDMTATIDGNPSSATVHPLVGAADLGNGYNATSNSGGSEDLRYDRVALDVGHDDELTPLEPSSTFELSMGEVGWQSTGQFESLTLVPDSYTLSLAVITSDPDLPQQFVVDTAVPVDSDGHVGPFLLQDVIDGAQVEIDALGAGPVSVLFLSLGASFEGPVVGTYGQ
jgi:hypothetical protein